MSDSFETVIETLPSPASIRTPYFIQNTKNKEIYNYQQVLGHGSYGTVYLANEIRGGKNYALKKFINPFLSLQRAVTTYRELYFAQHFSHPNLVHYKSIFFDDRENPKDIFALYDFMDMDLRYVLNSQQPLTLYHIQFFIYHLLCGVKYMHSAGVMHRDIKPENILINANCQLKLGDYGMSRVNFPTQYSNYICSRWYRAPEILFSIDYTESVDIWAVGCILAELLIKHVLFPGKSTNHQLQLISELLGPPSSSSVCSVNNLKNGEASFNDSWTKTFEGCDPVALNLLQSLLVWNYTKRPTASQALRHPFFFKVFCPSCEKAAPFKLLVPVIKNYKIDEIVNNMVIFVNNLQ